MSLNFATRRSFFKKDIFQIRNDLEPSRAIKSCPLYNQN